MDKENLDKKNFIKLVSESQILNSDNKNKMPDFTNFINKDNSNKDQHKRFRDQKSK